MKLTPRQAAELLGLSKERVLQFVREGRLPAETNAHGYYEIDRRDVLGFRRLKRKTGRPRTVAKEES